ncbi:MAG TPA: hypothetical protein ENK66_10565 [Arcobacter sp.]|nr:hypothetical protein [Arcobacter sp.]
MVLTYKKFVFALFILSFSLIGIYSYIVLNYKHLYMSQEYPMWSSIKSKMYTNHQGKYNFLFIGDSRAKTGFIPKDFDEKTGFTTLNLSIGGGTPIEGYFSLKTYIENNKDKLAKHVLLSYAPFHLVMQDSYWSRTVRFDFLKKEEYHDILNMAEKLNDVSTLGNLEDQQSDFYTGKYLIEFFKGITQMRWKTNQKVAKELILSHDHCYFGGSSEATSLCQETEYKHFNPSKLLDNFFKRTLVLARKNGMELYYYTMPLSELSYKHVNVEFVSEYNRYIKDLSKSYKMKSLNTLTYRENTYFGDASHLFKGATIITSEIADKLRY